MKFKELAQMSKEEREKKFKELELELIKLNAQVATGTPPKNSGQLKRIKKDIAKMMFLKGFDEQADAKKKPIEAEKISQSSQLKSPSNNSFDKNKEKTTEKEIKKTK